MPSDQSGFQQATTAFTGSLLAAGQVLLGLALIASALAILASGLR